MNLKTGLTRPECAKFRRLCNFTAEELAVFDLRVQGYSIVEISTALNLSDSTVSRRIRNIKVKICKLQ